jgi:hypothetical protein
MLSAVTGAYTDQCSYHADFLFYSNLMQKYVWGERGVDYCGSGQGEVAVVNMVMDFRVRKNTANSLTA